MYFKPKQRNFSAMKLVLKKKMVHSGQLSFRTQSLNLTACTNKIYNLFINIKHDKIKIV